MADHLPEDRLRGMALVAVAVLVFALMDSTTKHLATSWNVPLVVAARYIGNLAFVLIVFLPRDGLALFRTQRTTLVIIRAGSLGFASLFAGLAFQRMPVAEATSIIYLAPIGVTLLAGYLLGEHVALTNWLAVAIGFCGVLLITRPGSGLDPFGAFFALLTAGSTISYFLLSRVLAKTETTEAMMLWCGVVGTVMFGVTLPWTFYGPIPGTIDTGLFIVIGGLALIGHFLFTAAYRYAPASALAPVNYLHLGWAGLLGWLVFGHVPDAYTALGIAMVALAGAGAALYAHLTSNPPRALARKGA